MKTKRRSILNKIYAFLFFVGLFLGFGIAGAVDTTDIGSISCMELIVGGFISVALMIPLVLHFKRSNPWSE